MMLEQLRKNAYPKCEPFWISCLIFFCQFPTQLDRNLEASPLAKWHHRCLVLLQHHLAGACTQPCQIVPAFLTRGYQRLIAGKMRTMNLILPAAAFRKILGHFSQSRPWIWGDAQLIRRSPENVISTQRISYRLRNCGNIDPSTLACLGDVNLVKKHASECKLIIVNRKRSGVAAKQIFRYTECLSG